MGLSSERGTGSRQMLCRNRQRKGFRVENLRDGQKNQNSLSPFCLSGGIYIMNVYRVTVDYLNKHCYNLVRYTHSHFVCAAKFY